MAQINLKFGKQFSKTNSIASNTVYNHHPNSKYFGEIINLAQQKVIRTVSEQSSVIKAKDLLAFQMIQTFFGWTMSK